MIAPLRASSTRSKKTTLPYESSTTLGRSTWKMSVSSQVIPCHVIVKESSV